MQKHHNTAPQHQPEGKTVKAYTDEDTESEQQQLVRSLREALRLEDLEAQARPAFPCVLIDWAFRVPFSKIELWIEGTHQCERLNKFIIYRSSDTSITCAVLKYRVEITRED